MVHLHPGIEWILETVKIVNLHLRKSFSSIFFEDQLETCSYFFQQKCNEYPKKYECSLGMNIGKSCLSICWQKSKQAGIIFFSWMRNSNWGIRFRIDSILVGEHLGKNPFCCFFFLSLFLSREQIKTFFVDFPLFMLASLILNCEIYSLSIFFSIILSFFFFLSFLTCLSFLFHSFLS